MRKFWRSLPALPASATTVNVPAGYYAGGTLDTAPAYNAGFAAGKIQATTSQTPTGMKFYVTHTHCGACYGPASASYVWFTQHEDSDGWHWVYYKCSACNTFWECHDTGGESYSTIEDSVRWKAEHSGHIVGGCCPYSSVLKCTKQEGVTRIETDSTNLGGGDHVTKVEMIF